MALIEQSSPSVASDPQADVAVRGPGRWSPWWGTPDHRQQGRPGAGPWVLVLALLVGAVCLVIVDRRAPTVPGAATPSAEFSTTRAMGNLEVIAQEPHHIGQPDHGRVRDHLVAELEAMGIETHVQPAVMGGETLHNVLGRIPGTDSTGALLFVAHYDSVVDSAGATDNAVSVVALLEMARAVTDGPPLRNDVIVLLDDAEESGLGGSRAFVQEHPWASDVGFVVNLDGGGQGPSVLAEVNGGSGDLIRTYARVVPGPRASSAMVAIADALQDAGFGGSDFSELRALDEPGFFFAHSADAGISHTPADQIGRVEPATIQHHGTTVLALAREYGNRDLSGPTRSEELVFPGLFTNVTLLWGNPAAMVMLAVVLLLFVALVTSVVRRGGRPRAILIGLAASLLSLVVAPVATILVVRLVALRPGYGPFFRRLFLDDNVRGLGLPNAELLYWGLLLVPLTVTIVVLGRARRRTTPPELFIGAVTPMVGLAALSTLGLVGASYLFVLPTIGLLAGSLAWVHLLDERTNGWAPAWVVAVAGLPLAVVAAGFFWSLQVFTVGNTQFLAIFVVLFSTPLVLQFEIVGAVDSRLPVTVVGGLAVALVAAGAILVAPEPLMAKTIWEGPTAENRSWTAVPDLTVPGATVDRMETDTGRVCLTARSGEADRTWCPLPAWVAVPLDLQLLPAANGTLLFGGSPQTITTFVIRHDGGQIDVPAVKVAGVPGSTFAVLLPSGVTTVEAIVGHDDDGREVARHAGFSIANP